MQPKFMESRRSASRSRTDEFQGARKAIAVLAEEISRKDRKDRKGKRSQQNADSSNAHYRADSLLRNLSTILS